MKINDYLYVDEYDNRDLADIVFDEVPFVKEAYQEYTRDRGECNDDEEYYKVYRGE